MSVDYLADGVRAAGMTALWVAPTVANRKAPTVTEFTAPTAFPIHCNIDAFSLTPTQNKIEKNRFCLKQKVQKWGDTTWGIEDLNAVYNPQDLEDPNFPAAEKMLSGTAWEIFYAPGLDAMEHVLAAGDIGNVVPVTVGTVYPKPVANEEGEELQIVIPLVISAPPELFVKLVA